MALTVTEDRARVERISRNFCILTGSIAFDNNYQAGGMDLADVSKYFTTLKSIIFEGEAGYLFEFDKANDTVVVYHPSDMTVVAEAAHTHEVILDTGASAAGASHDHALSGATAAGSSHTHGVGTLADGASGGPSATVTAGYLLYNIREDPGVWELDDTTAVTWGTLDFSSLIPAGAVAVRLRMKCRNSQASQEFGVRQSSDVGGTQSMHYLITPGANVYCEGEVVCECEANRTIQYNSSTAGAWSQLRLTLLGWYEQVTLPTGAHTHAVALDTGVSGAETAHTHAVGTLDAAAESTHTHGPGTLEDDASAAGSSHTHTATAAAGVEVGSGDDLSGITALQFIAVGLKD